MPVHSCRWSWIRSEECDYYQTLTPLPSHSLNSSNQPLDTIWIPCLDSFQHAVDRNQEWLPKKKLSNQRWYPFKDYISRTEPEGLVRPIIEIKEISQVPKNQIIPRCSVNSVTIPDNWSGTNTPEYGTINMKPKSFNRARSRRSSPPVQSLRSQGHHPSSMVSAPSRRDQITGYFMGKAKNYVMDTIMGRLSSAMKPFVKKKDGVKSILHRPLLGLFPSFPFNSL